MTTSHHARTAARARWESEPDRSAATAAAREALAASFVSDDERSAHYRRLAARSAEVRRRKATLRRLARTRHLRLQVPVKWWRIAGNDLPWHERAMAAVRLAHAYRDGSPIDRLMRGDQ